MIPLIVALALAFAWAVIVTGFAVAEAQRAAFFKRMVDALSDDVERLQDRLQSSSLSEYTANRRVAMEPYSPRVSVKYRYDDTGLVRDIAEPEDEDQ